MAALDDQLAHHHRAAFGWALACCHGDRSAAEDVLQTAYLKLIDGRARYGGQSDFRAFLFGVIRLTASEDQRRRAVRAALSFALSRGGTDEVTVAHPGVGPIVRAEQSRALLAALERLSARQREVLHLVFYQDLSIDAAAAVLNISIGSARVHYERGKARLRQLLSEGTFDAE